MLKSSSIQCTNLNQEHVSCKLDCTLCSSFVISPKEAIAFFTHLPLCAAIVSRTAMAHSQQSSTEDASKHIRLLLPKKPPWCSLMLNLGASPASNWHFGRFKLPRGVTSWGSANQCKKPERVRMKWQSDHFPLPDTQRAICPCLNATTHA